MAVENSQMFGLQVLSALLLAGSALAHVRMTAISVNGGAFQTNSVRLPPSNSPVTDVTSVRYSFFLFFKRIYVNVLL